MSIKGFDKYVCGLIGSNEYDFTDKTSAVNAQISYMLSRTQSMFAYDSLPDTIPARSLELFAQINGNVFWMPHKEDLYIYTGGMGGEQSQLYMPTIYTIANPAQNLSVNAKIGVDGVVMPNDSMYIGLLPLFRKYATAMVETELSLRLATINSRIYSLISAGDDRTKASAETYIRQVEAGKPGIIAENAFVDGIKAQPYGNTNRTISELIELEQYWKASWYNELGLNANYNMKRESLNSAESQLNDDALLPLVDDMLRCRQTAIEQINKMFGTHISVRLNSAWLDNAQELELEQAKISGQPENAGEENENAE